MGVSIPNCLAYGAGAETFPYGRRYDWDLLKLVGPLAARKPGLRLALALEIERDCSADGRNTPPAVAILGIGRRTAESSSG